MKINYTLLIYGVISSFLAAAQQIPLNKYGLPVVDQTVLYKELVAKDSNMAMVDLTKYIPGLKLDVRYATPNNFTHQVLYPYPMAFLRLPAAKALKRIASELNKQGIGIIIYDGYRPYSVTEKMWEIVPDDRYAADPHKGSGHNRGVAVDLSLYDLKTGNALEMPTDFDDFTEKAHQDYNTSNITASNNRKLLRTTMEQYGFVNLTTEWWHFYLKDYQQYPLMDIDFTKQK